MKKIFTLMLGAALAFGFVSCKSVEDRLADIRDLELEKSELDVELKEVNNDKMEFIQSLDEDDYKALMKKSEDIAEEVDKEYKDEIKELDDKIEDLKEDLSELESKVSERDNKLNED